MKLSSVLANHRALTAALSGTATGDQGDDLECRHVLRERERERTRAGLSSSTGRAGAERVVAKSRWALVRGQAEEAAREAARRLARLFYSGRSRREATLDPETGLAGAASRVQAMANRVKELQQRVQHQRGLLETRRAVASGSTSASGNSRGAPFARAIADLRCSDAESGFGEHRRPQETGASSKPGSSRPAG